ncbi:MAG: hypothetical protein WC994_02300 [Brumimicrobium sp.]
MNWVSKISLLTLTLLFGLNDVIFSQINQVDAKGRKQGEWVKYYTERDYSDVIRYKGNFKNGKPVGKFVYYYPTREIRAVIVHKEGSNRSEAFLYHHNEKLAAHGIYINGKKDSIWTNFTPNGFFSSEESYKNDKLHGKKIVYYGEEVTITKRKLKLRVDNYNEGQLDGESVEYYPDGKVKYKVTYKNNKKVGKAFLYHPNGQVEVEEYWKEGKKHGLWKLFDVNAKEIGRRYFRNGSTVEGKALEKYLKELKEKGLTPYQ